MKLIQFFSFKLLPILAFFLSTINTIELTAASSGKDCKHKAYAQFSSYINQIPGKDLKLVTFEKTDLISGLKLESNNKVIVQEPGQYMILASGQAGLQGLNLYGKTYLMLIKNGQILPQTLSSETIQTATTVHGLVSQAVLALKKGDSISVGVASDTSYHGLVMTKVLFQKSPIPSVSFSMFNIE